MSVLSAHTDNGELTLLPAGRHEYPFSFQLPEEYVSLLITLIWRFVCVWERERAIQNSPHYGFLLCGTVSWSLVPDPNLLLHSCPPQDSGDILWGQAWEHPLLGQGEAPPTLEHRQEDQERVYRHRAHWHQHTRPFGKFTISLLTQLNNFTNNVESNPNKESKQHFPLPIGTSSWNQRQERSCVVP